MSGRILRSPGKVNLALKVLGARGGYHELDMIMAPIDLADELLVEPVEDHDEIVSGIELPADNTISRTLQALRREGLQGHYRITLKKQVPLQAGLGAASSNAAVLLRALSEWENLDISPERLEQIAFSIGADVPFFLHGTTARVGGRGEKVEPFPMPSFKALLVKPSFGISTPAAFGRLDRLREGFSELEIEPVQQLLEKGRILQALESTGNDLYQAAADLEPGLESIRNELEAMGAGVVMSGSGSTLIARFEDDAVHEKIIEKLRDRDLWVREVRIG